MICTVMVGRAVPPALTYCTACPDVLYRLPWQGAAAQLRASGNPFCSSYCWYITKCTQNRDIIEITQGRQGKGKYLKRSIGSIVVLLAGKFSL